MINSFACRARASLERSLVMLHTLPVELSLAVLSYLPLQTLCALPSLSRKWSDFFSQNQSTIFRNAAVLHGYTHPETYLLEDALSRHKGSPWEGATDWKDFCRPCFPSRRPFHVQFPRRLISVRRC